MCVRASNLAVEEINWLISLVGYYAGAPMHGASACRGKECANTEAMMWWEKIPGWVCMADVVCHCPLRSLEQH